MNVDTIQFFDLDGVVTNPADKQVNPEVLDKLAVDLKNRIPLIFETGRGWKWVRKNVIDPLILRIGDPSLSENIFISAEKSGVSVKYESGEWTEQLKAGTALPDDLIEAADKLTEKYSQILSRKEDKISMFSTEMHDVPKSAPEDEKNKNLKEFRTQGSALADEFRKLVTDSGLSDVFEVELTTVGLDIQPKGVGKRQGTGEAANWLKHRGIKAKIYEVFGDSKSDIDMAFELYEQGLPVKFIFVGDRKNLEGIEMPFDVEIKDREYDRGTVNYLKEEQAKKSPDRK